MKRISKPRVGAAALGTLAFVLTLPAALISAYAIVKGRLPYNEEGNHFDGVTVHHAGSEYVYALLALSFWAFAASAAIAAYRTFKRAGTVQREGHTD